MALSLLIILKFAIASLLWSFRNDVLHLLMAQLSCIMTFTCFLRWTLFSFTSHHFSFSYVLYERVYCIRTLPMRLVLYRWGPRQVLVHNMISVVNGAMQTSFPEHTMSSNNSLAPCECSTSVYSLLSISHFVGLPKTPIIIHSFESRLIVVWMEPSRTHILAVPSLKTPCISSEPQKILTNHILYSYMAATLSHTTAIAFHTPHLIDQAGFLKTLHYRCVYNLYIRDSADSKFKTIASYTCIKNLNFTECIEFMPNSRHAFVL